MQETPLIFMGIPLRSLNCLIVYGVLRSTLYRVYLRFITILIAAAVAKIDKT